jgi:hypothetical protein
VIEGHDDDPEQPDEETAESASPEGGDLLASWVGAANVRSDLAIDLTRWLERQLVSDQYARLEQAGHNLEEAVPQARRAQRARERD